MNRTKWLGGAAVVALCGSAPAMAQADDDEIKERAREGYYIPSIKPAIVVSASRAEGVPERDYTGSVTVITSEQIENRQVRDIADVLRDVPGVAVSAVAGQTQVRVRGAEANQVLVLVDGIEVADPFSGEFDIGTLQAEIGSRVEVLRGPQSALYGNDAVGGVIAYQSADARAVPGLVARIEGGTHDTVNGAARYGAVGERWDAALSATVVSTDGQPNARGGTRDIGRDSYTFSGKGSVDLSDGLTLRATGRYILTEGQANNEDFTPDSSTFGLVVDSPGAGFENEGLYALIGARYDALDGDWTHDLSAQIAAINRQNVTPFGLALDIESDRLKASYVTTYDFGVSGHALTFAADYEEEGFRNVGTFDERREIENVGLVGEYRYVGERADFTAAVRHDINDRFADTTTFRVGTGYRLTDTTRFRAAAGSGIKNPTFGELFGFIDGVFVGNSDLEPEKSTSWEVGFDQDFGQGAATLSATYFNAELENEIFTDFPPPDFIQSPANRVTDSTQQGVEVALLARLGSGFSFTGAYTFLDAEEDGVEEVRRPDHVASAVLNWEAPEDAASANLVVRYNGEAVDNSFGPGFVPTPVTLDDYTLVNLNARLRLTRRIEVFGRVDNLLDERYEQVFSFVSPGRSAAVGLEARF